MYIYIYIDRERERDRYRYKEREGERYSPKDFEGLLGASHAHEAVQEPVGHLFSHVIHSFIIIVLINIIYIYIVLYM